MLAFYVAYPSIHIFHSCISHPFYRLKTSPILQSYYPRFCRASEAKRHLIIRSIATPPNHIFFEWKCCLESCPNVLEPQINRTLNPSPFPSCIPSTLVAPSRDRFYFLNSLTLFSKIQTHT